MTICGNCGKVMKCQKTGARVYFEATYSTASGDVLACECGNKVLTGFGSHYPGWPKFAAHAIISERGIEWV